MDNKLLTASFFVQPVPAGLYFRLLLVLSIVLIVIAKFSVGKSSLATPACLKDALLAEL